VVNKERYPTLAWEGRRRLTRGPAASASGRERKAARVLTRAGPAVGFDPRERGRGEKGRPPRPAARWEAAAGARKLGCGCDIHTIYGEFYIYKALYIYVLILRYSKSYYVKKNCLFQSTEFYLTYIYMVSFLYS
jgi:hypothetical protein